MMMAILSQHKKVLLVVFGVLLAAGLIWSYSPPGSDEQLTQPEASSPPEGQIMVKGVMTCLPHKDTSGPQTLECAFGIRDETGRYFALRDSDPEYKNLSGVPNNSLIQVEGQFVPRKDSQYQDIGVIEVTQITTFAGSENKPESY